MPLKMALLITLSLSACAELPPAPRHIQYGAHAGLNPPGYYGVDSETKAREYRGFGAPDMQGAQCLSPSDFKAWSAWVQKAVEIAKQRCN